MPYRTLGEVRERAKDKNELFIQKILSVPLKNWFFIEKGVFNIVFGYSILYICSDGRVYYINHRIGRIELAKDKRVGELVKKLYKLHGQIDKDDIINNFLST